MSSRKKYPDEFKREAVALTQAEGVTLSQVARELGIRPNMLGRWRQELQAGGHNAFAGQGKPRDEEMTALKRELARVKKERDFLREAATFFAKESS